MCVELDMVPLPVTETVAIAYVTKLAEEGVKEATVKNHLAGLRQLQITEGLEAPNWGAMPRLAQIRRGIARHRAEQGVRPFRRDPVTVEYLRAMHGVWSRQGDRGAMLWAAACICYFGCLRPGEALAPEGGRFDPGAHLTFPDVVVDSLEKPREIRVRIKESKTDRVRQGATVEMGWTGTEVCPVKAILTYMLKRKNGPGPFFQMDGCRPLTQGEFNKKVREALESAGMDGRFISGHSFRIGAATAAAKGGATEEQIKTLGRWKSREYKGYIRTGDDGEQAAVTSMLAETSKECLKPK